MRPPPRLRGRLADLADRPVNYDVAALDLVDPPSGWTVDRRCEPLPGEPPGDPVSRGSWEIAAGLIRGYQFADPSLVRAYYDPDVPLQGRDMLLALTALGLVTVHVGVRVSLVWDEVRLLDERRVRVFGWAYRTLEGHLEQGQMDWQVWKWLDTGEVQFRSHAVSRTARIANPVVAVGFRLLKGHERRTYLESTDRRMRELTARALTEDAPAEEVVREASPDLTARGTDPADPAHEALASEIRDDGPDQPGQADHTAG